MQRLFSTFPNGWPGAGLLLLRCSVATALLADSVAGLNPDQAAIELLLRVTGIALALALALGVFTPVVGIAVAAAEAWYAMQGGWSGHHLLVAIVAVGLAMLGPGNWSIDARLYGRTRIDL